MTLVAGHVGQRLPERRAERGGGCPGSGADRTDGPPAALRPARGRREPVRSRPRTEAVGHLPGRR